jgi:hypothetical protein
VTGHIGIASPKYLVSSHYEWQEVGRYCGEMLVAAAPPTAVAAAVAGAAAEPHCHNTSLLALVYGFSPSVLPLIFVLADRP